MNSSSSAKKFEYKAYPKMNGFFMAAVLAISALAVLYIVGKSFDSLSVITIGIVALIIISVPLSGFIILSPNEHAVILFFGNYSGVIAEEGFFWYNPFASAKRINVRVENFETEKLKVNDANGNPIEIASVIVWRVVNAAQAMLSLEDYKEFVRRQSEAALREMANDYPYEINTEDKHTANEKLISLRENRDEIAKVLARNLNDHLQEYGIEIIKASISHLSYAPEIAAAMLQRQQANAIVDARKAIVKGAISIVDDVVKHYSSDNPDASMTLDNDAKGRLVTNMLVTLTSSQEAIPTVSLSK